MCIWLEIEFASNMLLKMSDFLIFLENSVDSHPQWRKVLLNNILSLITRKDKMKKVKPDLRDVTFASTKDEEDISLESYNTHVKISSKFLLNYSKDTPGPQGQFQGFCF